MEKHDKAELKKMIKAHRKEHHKPIGRMTKSELAAEYEKYRSPESVMAPAVKESSMIGQIAEEVHALGAETPKKPKASKAPVHHKKEDDSVKGQKALRMYQEHGHAEKAEHHGTKKGEERKTARKAYEDTPSTKAKAMSPYNAFVSKHRKEGKSMAEVAAMWKAEKH